MPRVSPTVLVVSDDLPLLDEVIRYLEEMPDWRLLGSAHAAEELLASTRENVPDAILISEGPAIELAGQKELPGAKLVVLGRKPSVEGLRAALDLGAKGFVTWPGERRRLKLLVEEGLSPAKQAGETSGKITTLWGPKGGSGTTVLAAHLAGSMSGLNLRCVLVDLDLEHGDQAAVLGVGEDHKTVVDLLRVVDEISAEVLENVAWQHPKGFGVVFAPGSPGEQGLVKMADITSALDATREFTDHVLVDLPSGFDDIVFACAEASDRFLMVITPDVLSLRRGREAMRAFRSAGIDESSIEIVLNRAGGDISAKDVEAVLGRPVVSKVRLDMRLLKAADRGELAKTGPKLLDDLARRIGGLSVN